MDLVLHFRRQETNLLNLYIELLAQADQDTDGRLDDGISNHQLVDAVFSGKTVDGDLFEGQDGLDLFLTGEKFRALLDDLASAGAI